MIAKLEFFKGFNSRFWSKIGHFANPFFEDKVGQSNVFGNILSGKKSFYRLHKANF